MSKSSIYLDFNATSPLDPLVEREIRKHFSIFGNPSSLFSQGRQAHNKIEDAREILAQFIDANAEQIIFTSSGTEGNNQVLWGNWLCAHLAKRPFHLAVSSIEHACVRNYALFLQTLGATVSWIKVDQTGCLDLAHLEELLTQGVDLVSIMLANNEIGTIQDLPAIRALTHRYNVPLHTDAVQAVGKIPVSFKDLDVDFMTLSAHKFGGPKGVGAIIAKQPQLLPPLLRGGGQEKGRRAGTENTLGIIGLGAACAARLSNPYPEGQLRKMTTELVETVIKSVPDCFQNGHPITRIANTINLSFGGVKGPAIVMNMDLEGFAISTGSACSTGSIDPSPVLVALCVGEARTMGAIRISVGASTTPEELEKFSEVLPKVITRLRQMR